MFPLWLLCWQCNKPTNKLFMVIILCFNWFCIAVQSSQSCFHCLSSSEDEEPIWTYSLWMMWRATITSTRCTVVTIILTSTPNTTITIVGQWEYLWLFWKNTKGESPYPFLDDFCTYHFLVGISLKRSFYETYEQFLYGLNSCSYYQGYY